MTRGRTKRQAARLKGNRTPRAAQRGQRPAGGLTAPAGSSAAPIDADAAFWHDLTAHEGEMTTLTKELTARGVDLPDPTVMTDEQLTAKLWEVVRALARIQVYLEHTDHLSDRELYVRLWQELLPEETDPPPISPGGACIISIIGGYSEEDVRIHLEYYADEETRELLRKDMPDNEMPPHRQPPYDRDRHLPRWSYGGSHATGSPGTPVH